LLRFGYILVSLAICGPTFAQCPQGGSPLHYQVGEGEYPAFIARKFKLGPLWCENCAVKKFLRLNHFSADIQLEAGSWVLIPPKCESTARAKNKRPPGAPMPASASAPLKIVAPPASVNRALEPAPEPEAPLYVRSPLSSNGVVIASKDTGLMVENGKNDWSLLECHGERTAQGCIMHHGFQEFRLSNRAQNFDIKNTATLQSTQISSFAQPGVDYILQVPVFSNWSAALEIGASYLRFSDSDGVMDSDKTLYGQAFLGIALNEGIWDLQLDIGRQEVAALVPTSGIQLAVLNADFNLGRLKLGLRPLSDLNFWKISLQWTTGISARSTDPGLKQLQELGLQNEFCFSDEKSCDWIYGLDLNYQNLGSDTSRQAQSAAVLSFSRRWGN
jgi:hypothetical protein